MSPFNLVLFFLLSVALNFYLVSGSSKVYPASSCYKSSSPYQSVCPPAYIPFKHNGDVNYDVIPEYVRYLCNAGIRCIFVCPDGTLLYTFGVKDRVKIVSAFKEAAEICNMTLIPDIGGLPMRDSMEMARKVKKMGIDIVVKGAEQYYEYKTNKTSANVDLICRIGKIVRFIYYDNPRQVSQNMAKFWSLAMKKCPDSLAGMVTNLYSALRVIASNNITDQQYILVEGFYYSASAFGCCFGSTDIMANIYPKVSVKIENYIKTGCFKEAIDLQLKYNTYLGNYDSILSIDQDDATAYIYRQPLIRHLTAKASGIELGPSFAPYRTLTSEEKERLDDMFEEYEED